MFAEYKANRPPTPEDIILSVPYVKRLLEAMCIPVLEVAGFEADDVIGTLAKKGAAKGYSINEFSISLFINVMDLRTNR